MKETILKQIITALEFELSRLLRANEQSTMGANHAPVPGSQRDTSGLEASYLASGYAAQCNRLSKQIEELKNLKIEDFTGQEIDIGALVDVEVDEEQDCYLLLHCGGGRAVSVDEKNITVITPDSPVGKALMGNFEAGSFSFRPGIEGIIVGVC
jgi:hypothetical protein